MQLNTPWGGVRAELYEHAAERAAVVLPGVGYTPAQPLLHFTRAVLERSDWSVLEVWWDYGARPEDVPPEQWATAHLDAALARLGAPGRLMVVGKSLGTLTAGAIADRTIPAIWLTPLLQFPLVADALKRAEAPALVVCGGRDDATREDALEQIDADKLVVPDADHSLELPDPVASVDALREVVGRVDRFVRSV